MTQALITINAVPGSNDNLPINVLVQLNNQNTGGELTFLWSILDQPPGPADSLSSTVIQNPTFTPLKEGSYLIKLVVNFGLPDEQTDSVIAAVRQVKTLERIPAAGETTQDDTSDGWATSMNSLLRRIDQQLADTGYIVGANASGGSLTAGDVVRVTSGVLIKAGLPGQELVPGYVKAPANVLDNLDELLCTVISDLAGNLTVANGDLFRARFMGRIASLPLGAGAVGDTVYVTDTATISTVQGTYRRRCGSIMSVSGGNRDVWFDGVGGQDITPITAPYVLYGAPPAGMTSAHRIDGNNATAALGGIPNQFMAGDASTVALVARRFSGLGLDIFQAQDETGVVLAKVDALGNLTAVNITGVNAILNGDIYQAYNSRWVVLSGGNSVSAGAHITLFGGVGGAANLARYDAALHSFRDETGANKTLVVDPANRYVGIGVITIPTCTLDVRSAAPIVSILATGAAQNAALILQRGTSTGGSNIYFRDSAGGNSWVQSCTDAGTPTQTLSFLSGASAVETFALYPSNTIAPLNQWNAKFARTWTGALASDNQRANLRVDAIFDYTDIAAPNTWNTNAINASVTLTATAQLPQHRVGPVFALSTVTAGGSITNGHLASFRGRINIEAGSTVTYVVNGVYCEGVSNAGTIGNVYGVYVEPMIGVTGTVGSNYGVCVGDQNIAGATNYAIYTGLGATHLGDYTEIVRSTPGITLQLQGSSAFPSSAILSFYDGTRYMGLSMAGTGGGGALGDLRVVNVFGTEIIRFLTTGEIAVGSTATPAGQMYMTSRKNPTLEINNVALNGDAIKAQAGSGTGSGISASSTSATGQGVLGFNTAAGGNGVYGQATTGYGVYGTASAGAGNGVRGETVTGVGVYAIATGATGVPLVLQPVRNTLPPPGGVDGAVVLTYTTTPTSYRLWAYLNYAWRFVTLA